MTEVIVVDAAHPEPDLVRRAAALIQAGRLVAFPTETVYGLGVNALDRDAVVRLFDAKERPPNDPLIVHVDSLDAARPLLSSVPGTAETLASRFWPGPLTLVLPRSPVVPNEVTAGLDTVAIRVPAHPVARALVTAAGVPVAAPSANLFSRPSPTTAAHVMEDLRGRIDLVLDGGPTPVGVESTVLDVTGPDPIILRPGAVTLAMLLEIMPRVRASGASGAGTREPMRAPGLLEKHYSPRAPLILYEGTDADLVPILVRDAENLRAAGREVGLLAAEEDRPHLPTGAGMHVVAAGSLGDLRTVAARLYAALRELDTAGVDVILARDFSNGEGLAAAIHDRLRRAAAGRVVRC